MRFLLSQAQLSKNSRKTKKTNPVRRILGKSIQDCFFSPDSDSYKGVLTSNRGEADEPLWRIGRGTKVPLQGAIVVCYGWGRRVTTNFGGVVVVPLQGAIVVCYGWGAEVATNFGGVVVVPLQGAIVVCYGWGAEGDDQFWWSGRGAIAGCHCSVLWLRGGG